MSIEKDIRQLKFRNEYQKAVINIIFTHNWMNEKLKIFFDNAGLTGQQFNILRILRGSETPLSTLQIRERMLDRMSDTSRIVDRLLIKSYVKKIACKTDKRLVDVSITDKGKKVLKKMDSYQQDMDMILSALKETEAKTLNKLLDKIRTSN
ncbi:MAG: MarR family transcriptional regulator [Ferruginibacter sp.]